MPGILQLFGKNLRIHTAKSGIREIPFAPFLWINKPPNWIEKMEHLERERFTIGEEKVINDDTYIQILLPVDPSEYHQERKRLLSVCESQSLQVSNHQLNLLKFIYSHHPKLFDYEGAVVMHLDIETKNLLCTRDRIEENLLLAIGYTFDQEPKKIIEKFDVKDGVRIPDEKAMIQEFINLVREKNPDIIVDYHGDGFDFPVLIHKADSLGIPFAIGRDGSIPTIRECYCGALKFFRNEITIVGREHIDIWVSIKGDARLNIKIEQLGLKSVCEFFNIFPEGRVEIEGQDIYDAYQNNHDNFIKYLEDDVHGTRELYERVITRFFIISKETNMPLSICQRSGTVKIWDQIIMNEYVTNDILVPDRQTWVKEQIRGDRRKNKGGLNELYKIGLVTDVAELDFDSHYPSIIAANQYKPRNDPKNYFCKKMVHFLLTRRDMKKQLKKGGLSPMDKDRHTINIHAFKILANGGNGYHGTQYGYFSDYEIYYKVTNTGQKQLLDTEKQLKNAGFRIIQLATDGIKMHHKKISNPEAFYGSVGQKITDYIQKKYESTNYILGFEGYWPHAFFLNMKSYVLVDPNGKATVKGTTFKDKKIFRYLRETLRELAIMVTRQDEPGLVVRFVKDSMKKIWNMELEPRDLLIYQGLKKKVDYTNAGYKERSSEYYNMTSNCTGVSLLRKYQRMKIVKKKGDRVEYFYSNQGTSKNDRLLPIEAFQKDLVDWKRYEVAFVQKASDILRFALADFDLFREELFGKEKTQYYNKVELRYKEAITPEK